VIRILARQHPLDSFRSIESEDADTLAEHDLIWIDIAADDHSDFDQILADLGIAQPTFVESIDGLFRGISEGSHSVQFVLSVPEAGTDSRLAIDQVAVSMGRRVLVTQHDDPVAAIDRLWDPETLNTSEISSPAALAAGIGQSGSRQMIPLIEVLEVRIDGLEDLAFAADPRTLTEIHVLRRDLITLRRIAGRQRDVLQDLSVSVHFAIGSGGQEAFEKAADHTARVVDSLESTRNLLASVLETYRGAVADQTNEIVRILTVFSAILFPLTLIAGIFGMNFDFIPTSTESWGFWAWIGVMAVVAAALWFYFVKRGFVGGPKLRELPRAVGLGIVAVGTVPVKAIASGVGSTVKYLDPRNKSEDD
jgi:magnesium transporter